MPIRRLKVSWLNLIILISRGFIMNDLFIAHIRGKKRKHEDGEAAENN